MEEEGGGDEGSRGDGRGEEKDENVRKNKEGGEEKRGRS